MLHILVTREEHPTQSISFFAKGLALIFLFTLLFLKIYLFDVINT